MQPAPRLDNPDRGMPPARVVSIFVAPERGAAMQEVEYVRAVPGRGLEGDRYFVHASLGRNRPGRACSVTLIEAEALEALEREHGIRLAPAESRRNILTCGIGLNTLVGLDFCVGEVTLRGVKLCEPCLHLEAATQPGVLRGLVHRGGLKAEILSEGIIHQGTAVQVAL
jgi:MOSC domain-containing protein YiiM